MGRPLFRLGKRLGLCASMVREGVSLADIGTDHGYLPIWLSLHGRISRGIAADIRPGPLCAAEKNIVRWKADKITTRLSDGLKEIQPEEADDIVIAGMGGELIARIIRDASWLKNREKHLILQPMTSFAELRSFLLEEGYAILREEAILEERRAYSVILAVYDPEAVNSFPGYAHIGGIDASTQAGREYLKARAISLRKQAIGLRCQKELEEADEIENIVSLIIERIEEGRKGEEM